MGQLAVDTVFAVLIAAATLKRIIYVLLRNGKGRGCFVLCLRYCVHLFLYGGEICPEFFLIGNTFLTAPGRLCFLRCQA